MAWQTVDALDVQGQTVLVRLDLNVPLADGRITDDLRIRAALPTLRSIVERGGTAVCMSHLGRPKGVDETLRLTPVAARLAELLQRPVGAVREVTGPAVVDAVGSADAGSVMVLENLRFDPGEKANDPDFGRALAALGTRYVNDAFGTAHRAHASVVGIPAVLGREHVAAGFLLGKELDAFSRVLTDPARPLVAILGGAKISDKLGVVENLAARVDRLLIGGAMAYTFLAAKGVAVGDSRVEAGFVDTCRELLGKHGDKLMLPSDHVIAPAFESNQAEVCAQDIPAGTMGLDIGPKTAGAFAAAVAEAGTVVWNGPMGVFERPAYAAGTEAVARAVAEASAYTVVGGGDSAAAIKAFGLFERVDHVSTGGGASLQLLEGKALPGLTALGA